MQEVVDNNVEIAGERILDLDASTLAKMIATRELTSREVTEIFIGHILELNPTVNFLVEERFQLAREEAHAADRAIANGETLGKLHGVPISMKESFDVADMQTTGGLVNRKGIYAKTDADVVKKLKNEGAIILGKSNTPALCFCQETDNKLYGRTNNPRDLSRTVGGSSGGEGAWIAVGGAAAGLGSDIGGSIRFPSHFNGIVGFKSGKYQVSSVGSYPPESHELQSRMLGIGPMTKSVKDAELIYQIIAEIKPVEKEISNYTIDVLASNEFPLSTETGNLLDEIHSVLKEQFRLESKTPPFFRETAVVWQEIMSINGATGPRKEAFGEGSQNPIPPYLKEKISGKSNVHKYLSWAFIGATLFKPSDKRVKEISEFIAHGDEILNDYLNERILVFPVYHTTAPEHGVVYGEIFSIRKTYQRYMPYTAYANVWGLPSLTIPVGKDKDGMPIGVQLMSKNGNEDALFKLGKLIEEKFMGYERVKR